MGFGSFAEQSAPGVLNVLRKNGITKGLVIDLGCGSRSWASRLANSGYDVLGIDLSPHMIALARRRVPQAALRAAYFLDAAA